jgi:hypothetical protein
VEHARSAAQKLTSSPPIVNAADGVTNIACTVSNQMGVATSLGSLLDKVEMLVRIGDEVAKVCLSYVRAHRTVLKWSQIHPYVNFAWQVLSVGFKVNRIRSWSADELKKYSDLQDIVKRILKQTIQCAYFIQQYAQRDFGGKRQLYEWCNEEFI